MGFLKKYLIYRWITGGSGGPGGVGLLILGMFVIVMLIAMAIANALLITYEAIRSVLLIAPLLLGPLAGAGIAAGLAVAVGSKSQQQVAKALQNRPAHVIAVGIIPVNIAFVGGLILIEINSLSWPIQFVFFVIALAPILAPFIYPFRLAQLVSAHPWGGLYKVVVFTPLATGIVFFLFDLSLSVPHAGVVETVGTVLVVYGPNLIGAALLKYQLGP